MRPGYPLFLVLLLAAVASPAYAQTFRGFVTAGLNMSQVDGDDLAGYNRAGAFAGVGVFSDLSDRWRWSVAVAYTQDGARATGRELERAEGIFDRIAASYAAVPVNVHYMDWLSDDEVYYRLEFQAGLVYKRLVNHRIEDIAGNDLTDDNPFSPNALDFTLGALYNTSERLAFGITYNQSLGNVRETDREKAFRPKQLALRARYAF